MKYVINFTRGYTVYVRVQVAHNNDLTNNDKLDVLSNWEYNAWKSKDEKFKLDCTPDSKSIGMANGADLTLSIGKIGNIEIEKVTYHRGAYDSEVNTQVENGRHKFKIENIAVNTAIKIHVRPKDSVYVEWKDLNAINSGYTVSQITYTKPNPTSEITTPAISTGKKIAVKKGSKVILTATVDPAYEVEKWVVG